MELSLHHLNELNDQYKPKIHKEWHDYCWFIAPKSGPNYMMKCKYCKEDYKGGKSRFLSHLGGYSTEAKECPAVNIDARDFALQEHDALISKKEIKSERTKAVVTDDMKLSPQEHVKKMVSLDQTDSPDSQDILNTKPSASKQKGLPKKKTKNNYDMTHVPTDDLESELTSRFGTDWDKRNTDLFCSTRVLS